MATLCIEEVLIKHQMIIKPEIIWNLSTLLITGRETVEDIGIPLFELLKVNTQLKNIIMDDNVIEGYGVYRMITFFETNMHYLEELVLINCLYELEAMIKMVDFIDKHRSLRRFQFGVPIERYQENELLDELHKQIILTQFYHSLGTVNTPSYSINAAVGNSYNLLGHSATVNADSHCVVTLSKS